MKPDDLHMMKSPSLWPHDVLPVKKYGEKFGLPTCGIMYYLDDGACKFHLNVSPFGLLQNPDMVGIITTPEKLLADGWIVD